MKLVKLSLVLLATTAFFGCPEESKLETKRKELVEEVGGKPKRDIDRVKLKMDKNAKETKKRLDEALKKADESGGW